MRIVAGSLIVLSLLLAGCGFQLRVQGELPAAWSSIAVRDVVGDNPLGRGGDTWYDAGHEGIRRELVHALTEGGFTVEAGAPLTIELLQTSVSRHTASIDASASAAEYQIDYSVRYRVIGGDGATLVPDSTIRTDSSYRYNKTAVLGAAEQEIMVYEDLRRELARRMVDHLRRKAAAHATAP